MHKYAFTTISPDGKVAGQTTSPAFSPPPRVRPLTALDDSLPKIASEVLEWLNMIFCNHRRISFEWPDGGACTVGLLPGFTHRLPGDQSAELLIEARLGRHSVTIGLTSSAFLALLDGENAALLPPEIKCALLESYLGDAVWTFERTGGLLIRITGLTHDPEELPDRGCNLFFEISRDEGLSTASGYMTMDFQGLCCLAGRMDNQGRPRSWDQIAQWPVSVGFVLGRTRLHLSEIKSLVSDDIILLDGLVTESSQALPIRIDLAARPFWSAKMNGNQLVVETRLERSMKDLAIVTKGEVEEVADLEEIELELVFELGRKSMSLAEVRRIRPGYIFDLAADFAKPVSIFVNGGCIGDGELVKIDHHLGVRLTRCHQRQGHGDR